MESTPKRAGAILANILLNNHAAPLLVTYPLPSAYAAVGGIETCPTYLDERYDRFAQFPRAGIAFCEPGLQCLGEPLIVGRQWSRGNGFE